MMKTSTVICSAFLALCLLGPSLAAPRKKKLNQSDLIPIPDHLLDAYKSSSDDLNEIGHGEDDDEQGGEEVAQPDPSQASPTSSSEAAPPFGDPNRNLLPNVLPTGDPTQFALPVFLKEPSDTFLIKSRPATLHCRVAHALGVHFKCNAEVVEPTSREDHVEPETGIRYTEASVDIHRDQVEEYFSEFNCACVAISAKGSVVSKYALVTNAYLKKQFEVPPYSQQVARGGQVEMRCHPPKGRPTPIISWMQNDRPIVPANDMNFIVTGEGHLIVVAARLSDTSNYTCVAENVASRRFSDPATITVYVDGEWSGWTTWTGCSTRCGKGVQKRTRQCNSPGPINGGQLCAGVAMQKKPCTNECPGVSTDGGWSSWSSWSSCSPECFQHRRRTCTNPEPTLGGQYCDGFDLQTRNCSHGFCQGTGQLVMYGSDGTATSTSTTDDFAVDSRMADQDQAGTITTSATSDLTLYIVFGVALLVFALVIIVIVKILKKKNPNPNGYTLTSTDYGYGTDESKKACLGYSPDITHNVATVGSSGGNSGSSQSASGMHGHMTPTTVCYEYSYPDSNSNHSNKAGFVRAASEHHYEQPMVLMPSSHSPSDSLGKPTRSDTSSSISNNGGHTSPIDLTASSSCNFPVMTSTPLPNLMTPPPPPTQPPPQLTSRHSLPQSPDPRFTSWASVTASGARIVLAECDVCVTIPPGAVGQGRSLDLFVSVIHHARPPLGPKETLLTPLVCIGPREAAVQLKKAVILTLPHCASLRHGHWRVSLLQSEAECFRNDNDHLRPWSRAVTLGQETLNTPAYVQLDVNNAHIMTDVFSSFALSGESATSGLAGKSLQLAAFAQEGAHRGPDLTVRVYVLPDNATSLAFVAESERRYNGRLLDKPMSFLMKDGGQDLCLRVEEVNATWCFQKGADYLEVPFNHIWHAANPNLHCSFTFRSRDRTASKLALTIGVSQKNATAGSSKNVLRVHCDLSHPQRPSPTGTLMTSASSSNNNFVSEAGRFRLNANMLSSLSKLLDPPTPEGHDWRLLAERLNVHRYVTFFATRPSPTEAILQLWEARNREMLALSNLINILRGMGRFDAAAVIEQQLH